MINGVVYQPHLFVCVQKFPTDKAYFIAKELLTTERTYLNDLKVITEVKISDLFLAFLYCYILFLTPNYQRLRGLYSSTRDQILQTWQ